MNTLEDKRGIELEKAKADLAKGEVELRHAIEDIEKAEHEIEEAESEEHRKDHWVVVNGRRKEVHTAKLTFDEVVALAFDPVPHGDGVQITVQYTRGPEHKPSGTLVEGQSVKVKDGMEFDVTSTNRS